LNNINHIFLLLFALASLDCSSQPANDSATIVKLLKEDYATMGSLDIKAHLTNLTNDYLLLEHGRIWDAKTEVDSIYRKYADSIFTRTDFFTIKTLKISGNMAYGVWHLRSEFRQNGTITELTWNESGVFRKEKGGWKIALIHSSRERQD
jgi:ketosteroid isomerase-like protein